MAINSTNSLAIAFNKLSGKVHTQQNFAVTEEGISTNVQMSYSTVFANPIVKLPVTTSGMSALYATNGIVERVKFQIDIIPDTQIAVGKSQGYRLKLPSDYNTFGILFPEFSAGTYLHTALGKLQIVPSLYGTLKPDGSTEYDPILYQTNGSTVIPKFDPINWYLDPYSGILFIQDPPAGYDSSSARPGYLEAFLYVGDYLDDISTTGTTSNVNVGNGLSKQGNTIVLGGTLTGNTVVDQSTHNLLLKLGSGAKFILTGTTGYNFSWDASASKLIAGNNCQSTGGSINYTFGDTNINSGSFGAVIFGETSEIAPGVGSALAVGENVYISGYGGIAFGRGTKAAGAESFIGGRWVAGNSAKTNPKAPQSNAIGSFGWYITDTNQINNHGGNATAGVILGGRNHNIPTGSDFSAIIGGDGIKAATGITNTVYLPKVRIGQGLNATLTTGSTSPDILVRNQTTGEIELSKITPPVVASNNFVFGTGTGIGAHASQFTANENVFVVMTQTPPTITGGANINNVFVFGEDIKLNGAPSGGGTVTDTGIFGFDHTIGDNISGFGGSGSLVFGNGNKNYGNNAFVGGNNSRVISNQSTGSIFEKGAVAIGLTTQKSGSEPVTSYRNAINISSNSTGQTVGHGAYGALSAIIGGQDHNIPIGGKNSAIIGGDGIKAVSGATNTVYLPKVRIGLGRNASLVTGSTSTNYLVRNSTTGEIEIGNPISGGSSLTALSKTLFVDLNGNDATAVKGNIGKPYQTLLAARNAATSGDTIIVFPGLYTENTNCAKNLVDWYFHDGAIIQPSSNTTPIFDTNSLGAVTFGVYGKGTFLNQGTYNNDTTAFVISNVGTSVYIEAKLISTLEVWRSGKAYIKNTEFNFQTAVYEGGNVSGASDVTFDNCYFNNSINFFGFYYGSGGGATPVKLKVLNCRFNYTALPAGYAAYTGDTHYVPNVNVISYTSAAFTQGGSGKAYYKNCDFYNLVGDNIYSKGMNPNTRRVIHTFDNCRFYCVDTSKKSIVYDDATDNEVIFRLINNYSNVGFGGAGTVTNQISGSGFIVDNNFEVLK